MVSGISSRSGVSESPVPAPIASATELEAGLVGQERQSSDEKSGGVAILPERMDDVESPACPQVLDVGVSASQGGRHSMEDVSIVVSDVSTLVPDRAIAWPEGRLWFGVFDGHHGACCADYAARHLHHRVLSSRLFPEDIEEAVVRAFACVDEEYLERVQAPEGGTDSGCTAVAGFVWGSELVLGNVGDCRAVVSRKGKAVVLTHDHRPSSESELRRIQNNGGFLDDQGLLNGELGVARALGNHVWGKKLRAPGTNGEPLLSTRPEMYRHAIDTEDEFMVVASDGLWDVASSQRVVELGRAFLMRAECYSAQKCANYLVEQALAMKATDNVSVVVVTFRPDPPRRRFRSWTSMRLDRQGREGADARAAGGQGLMS